MANLAEEVIRIVTNFDGSGIVAAQSAMESLGAKASESEGVVSSAFAKVGSTLSGVGQTMMGIGSTLTLGVTLPVVAGLGVAASAAVEFQQKMLLLTTQAGYTSDEVSTLSPKVLQLATQMGQAPSALAEGLYHIASTGIDASKAMDVLAIAAEGANVGQANLDDTVYSLTSTMKSGIRGAEDASTAMGVLNAIVGAGDMHFQDLNGAISTGFLASAQTFGVSLQSAGAALAFLTDRGESAQEAATRLRMAMAMMAAPTAQAVKLLEGIGISTQDAKAQTEAMTAALAKAHLTTTQLADDMRQPDGIQVALVDLNQHLKESGLTADAAAALISKAFGGARSGSTIEALAQNTDQLGQKFDAIGQKSGQFADSWAKQQASASQHVANLNASLKTLEIEVGDKVIPYLTKFADWLGHLVDWFGKLNPQQQDMAVALAAIAAAAGPVLIVLGGLVTTVGGLLSMFGKLQGATAAVSGEVGLLSSAISLLPLAVTIGVAFLGYEKIKEQIDGLKSDLDGLARSQAGVARQDNQIQAAIAKARAAGDTQKAANLEKAYQLSTPQGSDLNWFQQLLTGVPHFAGGVSNFSGGMALVGENGPELVNLPKGSSVTPNNQLGKSGGATQNFTFNNQFSSYVDTSEVARTLGRQIQMRLT